MSITVAELVALPHLGLEVVAGLAGLDREVGWAHVCELEDPQPWLEGGELLMTTGMAVPREPGRQAAYLERLAACGVAGLAISKDLCAPPLTPSFLRSAEKLGFPVVAVSIEVPFVAIARIVVYGEQRRIIAPARPADCRFRCAAGQHGAVRPARAVPPA